ncbi:hypothetical protein F3B56_28810 [Bacteroides ovatus]|nr:hypothetical protein F3B56_28810 [Bacteroides ovatus]
MRNSASAYNNSERANFGARFAGGVCMEVRRGEFELWATAGFGASFLTKKVCGGFFFLQMLCYGPVPFRNRCRVREIAVLIGLGGGSRIIFRRERLASPAMSAARPDMPCPILHRREKRFAPRSPHGPDFGPGSDRLRQGPLANETLPASFLR